MSDIYLPLPKNEITAECIRVEEENFNATQLKV